MFNSRGMDQTSQDEKSSQREKYGKIIKILIEAGYYRAKIVTLSEFDKVIGGLCWCIASSGEALDIDILFQENLNIGKRIKLSERIVAALIRMNCPHSLQAHQIQGNDFAAILPVMIWMIRKTMVYRKMTQESLKKFSTYQFYKHFTMTDQTESARAPTSMHRRLPPSKRLPRKYRRRAGLSKPRDEETQVHSCLVEYGERLTTASFARWNIAGGMTSALGTGADTADLDELSSGEVSHVKAAGLTGFERELATLARQLEKEEEEEQRKIEEEENRFLQQMQQADAPETGLSGLRVGELVEQQSSQISAAEASYATAVEARRRQLAALKMDTSGSSEADFSEEMEFRRRKVATEKKQAAQAIKVEALQAEVDTLQQKKTAFLDENLQVQMKVQQMERLEGQLQEQEAAANPLVLARLRRLVGAGEALAAQERSFKLNCKNQLAAWQAQLKELHEETTDEEAERYREIEEMHQKVMAKEAKLRSELAEKNRQCSSMTRVIDEVPSRTELIQYERRFTELYDQVNRKLKETRKYYEVYNTLDTTLGFLRKEVKLLNSITTSFDQAMATEAGKQDFVDQFQAIQLSVEDSLENQRLQYAKKISEVELLQERYQELLDEERKYFQAVKDFQKECDKNEMLLSKYDLQSK